MALTQNEKQALNRIFTTAEDLAALLNVYDPQSTADRAYVKAKIQSVRDDIEARRLAIPARATAENSSLAAQRNVLDGLLAKFP